MLPLSDSMNGRQIVVLYDPVFDGSFTNPEDFPVLRIIPVVSPVVEDLDHDDHEHRERYCHSDDVQNGAEPSFFSEKPFHFIL